MLLAGEVAASSRGNHGLHVVFLRPQAQVSRAYAPRVVAEVEYKRATRVPTVMHEPADSGRSN